MLIKSYMTFITNKSHTTNAHVHLIQDFQHLRITVLKVLGIHENFQHFVSNTSFPDIKIIKHKTCTKLTSRASHSCKPLRDIDQKLQNKAGKSGRMCLNDVANLTTITTTTTTSEQGEPRPWVLTKRTEKTQLLVADDAPVELEKRPLEAQDCIVLGRSQHVNRLGFGDTRVLTDDAQTSSPQTLLTNLQACPDPGVIYTLIKYF